LKGEFPTEDNVAVKGLPVGSLSFDDYIIGNVVRLLVGIKFQVFL